MFYESVAFLVDLGHPVVEMCLRQSDFASVISPEVGKFVERLFNLTLSSYRMDFIVFDNAFSVLFFVHNPKLRIYITN